MNEEQANEYLLSIGIEVPALIVNAWLDLFSSVQPCLEANYSDSVQLLILTNLISLYGYSAGTRYISSQSSPSGASRSFRYTDLHNLWRGNLNALRMLDKSGCVSGLIPPAPTGGGAFLGVGKGGSYTERC